MLNKVVYTDDVTVINAQNLNDIQDAIIENEETLDEKADTTGSYEDMTVGFAEQLVGTTFTEDRKPYLFKKSGGNGREMLEQIVGGSLGWNQLCNGSSVTVTSGHKYYMKKNGAESIGSSTGSAITGLTSGTDMVIDLTLDFGSTIADYIYQLESATAGAGIAKLKSWGIDLDTYHAYDAGSIQSVEATAHVTTTGKNYLNQSDITVSATTWLNKDIFLPVGTYTFSMDSSATSGQCTLEIFDKSGNTIYNSASSGGNLSLANPVRTFTITEVAAKIRSYINVSSSLSNIQIEKGSSRTAYEPYTEHVYPLGSDTLRGIPQLVNNELAYDGDVKTPDGAITRNYGIVDLGTLSWSAAGTMWVATLSGVHAVFDSAIPNAICGKYVAVSWASGTSGSKEKVFCVLPAYNQLRIRDTSYTSASAFAAGVTGTYLVYPLATPTTESGTAYQRVQTVDADGTEKFVANTVVPVGHYTQYPEDLWADLKRLSKIPEPPTANGTYTLKVTVANGVATYQWV